jgi:hypothetical protein
MSQASSEPLAELLAAREVAAAHAQVENLLVAYPR